MEAIKIEYLKDSTLHFMAGMSAAFLFSALSYPIIKNEDYIEASFLISGIGFSSSVIAGIVKELIDKSGFGNQEWRDLFFTILGGAIASSLVFAFSYLSYYNGIDPVAGFLLFGSYGIVLIFPTAGALIKQIFDKMESLLY